MSESITKGASRRARCLAGGFTLAEALLAATVLAIVAASATLPFSAGVQQVNEAGKLDEAAALGEAMMEEILARPFFDPADRTASPGPEGGLTRATYDNVDDFHGYSESAGNLKDFKNQNKTAGTSSSLWRSATVEYITFPGQQANDTNSFVRVTVNVYDGATAKVARFVRIVARED